jgi:hypothetical protein
MRTWLQDQYPLLGVKDLDTQIRSAVKDISPLPKKEKEAA